MLFTFFSETTSRGVTSLVERENLLRKVRFPRLVIPLAVALHALFNLGLNLIVVFVFVLAKGVEPRASWLEVVPLLLLMVLFATSVAMLVSALYVRYRDMQPIWEVALQILFYASPIIYVASFLPDSIEQTAMANPIASIVTQWRHAVIDPAAPTAAEAIGGGARLLIPLAIVVRHVRARPLGLRARGPADRGGPVIAGRGRRGGRRSCACAWRSSSASATTQAARPTPRWRPPRTATTGSTAGTWT